MHIPAHHSALLIFGERFSVRLPRRTVPIWVSDPMGLARPLRMARTPAINVVLTAPRPTSSTPNLPFAGAISAFFTTANYIILVASAQLSGLGAAFGH